MGKKNRGKQQRGQQNQNAQSFKPSQDEPPIEKFPKLTEHKVVGQSRGTLFKFDINTN